MTSPVWLYFYNCPVNIQADVQVEIKYLLKTSCDKYTKMNVSKKYVYCSDILLTTFDQMENTTLTYPVD